jgi:small subunit ribosomal protein S16
MLTLRLARAGSKKKPVYHLVAQDSRSRRDGRFVENLGYYVPAQRLLVVRHDRVDYWLSVGARSSATAQSLIRKSKLLGERATLPVAPKKSKKSPDQDAAAEVNAA